MQKKPPELLKPGQPNNDNTLHRPVVARCLSHLRDA
jgi:hypothetical protein